MKKFPILLVSGWAHGEEVLRPLAGALAAPGRPISRLSLAAASFQDDPETNISSYARAVLSHLDTSDEPGCLVGWSTGGVAAIETALRRPEKVACLVLLSATARFCSKDDYTSGVKPSVLRAMIRGLRKNPEAVVSDFLTGALFPVHIQTDDLARRTRAALAAGTDSLVRGLEYLASADFRRELPSIEIPCLIIHGGQDRIIPREAALYMHSNLPRSEIEPLDSAGHCLPEQCPEDLSRRIAQFLERL